MHKRTVLTGYASILLLLAMLGTLSMTPVAASPAIRRVPTEYPTIQAAINAASDGDTIQVASGIYYENVVVNKSLTLIGNGSSTTIIDGNGIGTVVRTDAPDVNITGFTVQNGGNYPYSNIFVRNCVRNTICYNVIRKGTFGIELQGANSCIIFGNKIMNNSDAGILMRDSSNNIIHYNMIANNSWGVWITSDSSLFNKFYHNNFIDNSNHAKDFAQTTKWDNGAEGNYWSDYEGLVDLDGDGIGDGDLDGDGIGEIPLPYMVPDFGKDNFPLMEPWSSYRVFDYNVTTFSNSTLASFNFSQPLKQISFNVTSGASGFCNVTIPKTLLNVSASEKWKVIIDGTLLSTEKRTVTENETHTSIYFTYTAGTHRVQITTVSSTVSIALSLASITLGSDVIISGNITADDPINPLRSNATVTIKSRSIGAVDWTTLDTVETDLNSSYTYTWTPATGGIHEVMASWEGDDETVGDESDVLALIVLYVFEPVKDGYVIIETNSTVSEFNSISAFNFSQPLKQISFNVTSPYGTIGYSNVTIPKALLNVSSLDEWKVLLIDVDPFDPVNRTVTENATHTSVYFTYSKGTHEIRITTRMSSTISLALSSDSIDLGSSVTISGNVTAEDLTVRPNVNVTILYRMKGAVDWTALATVKTDSNGIYTYDWEPEKTGTYQVKANWPGDVETLGDESDVLTLTAKWSSIISIDLSSTSIPLGESVTISGNIAVADNIARAGVNVTILYRLSGATEWTTLNAVETDESGNYNYDWEPEKTGTYQVKANWPGDDTTFGNQSDVLTLTVKGAAAFPLEIVAAVVVAVIVIAAIAIYFIKFRKP